ncbi:glucokinase [uncultured Novosphingobium sp.]|uniref:glucokinase n=1 Tax=uncultured Novosphingobium sp. TaxID=292277 RepID=UPI003747831F
MIQLVTVDIGGTHARFAIATIADDGAITLGEPQTLHTKDHASFQTAWEDFRARQGGVVPDSVAIAIAGPVGGEVIRFTNNPWVIRPALIPEKLGVSRYTLVNDFGAVGHAVARADAAHLLHLCGPDVPLPDQGAITVIGPGTGLGVAMLLHNPAGYHVQSTEGGHIDFAPHDVIEDAILARLRQRHNRVSVERVVSGPAIVDIYQALANLEGRAVLERGDVELWTAGTDGSDSLAAAAVDRFCMALGSAAGDFALAHGATGVVVAGGLGYRIRDALKNSAFARRFEAKGRFAGLMAAMPVKLIIHPQPGLFGAAAAFAREHLP